MPNEGTAVMTGAQQRAIAAHRPGQDVFKSVLSEVIDSEEPAQPSRMIVVIDHHAAHVYQDFGGSRPADEHKVQPYDSYNFHHHLVHRKEAHYRGERVPEEDSF